jgi:hypothetical protein
MVRAWGSRTRRRLARVGVVGALVAAAAACQPVAQVSCAGGLVVSVAGTVAEPAIPEASGIVSGWANPDVWWVHNDSGDGARVFAVGRDGADLGAFTVGGAAAVDWEDIAVGPGSAPGTSLLYVADIGDNAAARASVRVYRFPEPTVTGSDGAVAAADVDVLTFTYPGGPRDAEALLVDSRTGDLFVVSKSFSGTATLYRARADLADGSVTQLSVAGTISLGSAQAVTGGDLSHGGASIVLRTYQGVWTWVRPVDATVAEALAEQPCAGQAVAEGQGEAIGIAHDGSGYVTLSEGVGKPLNWFAKP